MWVWVAAIITLLPGIPVRSSTRLRASSTIHFGMEDAPGLSVFAKDDTGALYHTYSTYSRGLDMLNGAYHYLDIVPKGRDEEGMPHPMSWVRLRDEYAKA